MTPVLTAHSLSFAYERRRIVDLWSHEFGPGLCWLRGPNGSGKSTRLKLLAGALQPQWGSARVAGMDLKTQGLDYRREVAFVGAEPPPFEHLSPVERFGFLGRLYPRSDASLFERHVDGFGLRPFLNQPLRALSTGTQHKAALAAALALGTRVLLLDEPLIALDAAAQAHLQSVLAQAAAETGRLTLVVSHEALGVEPSAVVELA
ncbi:ATP-binding cassette domain-containing protein [Pelomonas sp. SE-A7]|uniref:ABC transporter ATP-binding protein n=1 Tax=Pelomonas sp. SE-A7 TaxID=3054953 RepID=UPI00259CBBEF|nr:ATP-binding cassette domain-containing protein [Pelomonas sp. SE-A7]MDM4768400.1 ATP-binding cassette domain-containing protein [Pelomonas sp. SE-A7]